MAEACLYELTGRVLVYVAGPLPPEQAEWDGLMRAIRAHGVKHADMRCLVWPDGGNISPTQRKQLADSLPKTMRAAVMTGSQIQRGVVTALAWFVDGVRAFPLDAEDGAVAYLGLGPEEASGALAVARRLHAKIKTL